MALGLTLSSICLFGCTPGSSFNDVQEMVGARTGGKHLHWMRSGTPDPQVQRAVQELLRRPLTADSAAQIALLNNRSVQAALEEIGIARAEYLQALLPNNPDFSGFVRHPSQPPFGANVEGQIAANILDLLLLPVRKKVASAELQAAKLEVASEVLGIVTETKEAFYMLQGRQQLLKRIELITKANEAALDITQGQHKAGNVTDLDLVKQQALYSESRVDVAQTRMKIRSDRERLNRLLGLWESTDKWRVGNQLPPISSGEGKLSNLEQRAIAERLDVALARQNVEAIEYALRARKVTRFLPTSVNIGVNQEKESDGRRLTGPTLDLQLPIFDWGQAAIPKLEAQYRQAQHQLEAVSVNARSEVREARDLVIASRDLANFYGKTLLPQQLQVVNQTQLQFNAMQVGPVDLLQAKERELETERAYVEAWRDYWLARVELERALVGGGDSSSFSSSSSNPMRNGQEGN